MSWNGPETLTTPYLSVEGHVHTVKEPVLKARNGLTFSTDQKMWSPVLHRHMDRVNSEAMFTYLDFIDALHEEELRNDLASGMDTIS